MEEEHSVVQSAWEQGKAISIRDTDVRFVMGKDMFRPDRGHIHHRLVSMGFSTKGAVWSLYPTSVVLCAFSLGLVYLHNLGIGVFLVSLGAVALLFMRKLGYLEYLAMDKIHGWLKDVSDEAGLSRERPRKASR